MRESKSVRSTPGKALDLILGGIAIWAAKQFFGGSGMVELVLAFAGGAFVLPAAEILWRRVRGPIKTLAEENVRGIHRIEELEKELWHLQHPDPLDIYVKPPIEPHLWDDLEQHSDLSGSRGHLLVFSNLTIANRSDDPMSLDFTVTLRLLNQPVFEKRGMTVQLSPILLEGRKVAFHSGILSVPAKDNRVPNMAFLLSELDAMVSGGPKNIADDGHSLRIDDLVSGKSTTRTFGVSRSPIFSITRNPFAVGDAKLTALRDTLQPMTNAKLLNIDVRIGDAVIEDGPKEHSNDPMDYGHLLVLRDVEVTNRSEVGMTLDYSVDLRLRESSLQHPGSGFVRAYPLKVPGEIVHSGYLEVPAHGTRTITVGLLLPQIAAAAAGGIENIANQGHMIWFTDRVSDEKNVKWFYLIRLGLDVQ